MADKFTISRFTELISRCDVHIKKGEIQTVNAEVAKISLSRVPRPLAEDLAKICRRAGLIEQGLRILYPIVRNEKSLLSPPTAKELCEYAVLLSRNGSIQEALGLLNRIDPSDLPESLLYRGFCYVSSWNYQAAAELFEAYIQTSPPEYSDLITRVNLAASYIALGRLAEAQSLLTKTIEMASKQQASRLVGNCLELRGQTFLLLNKYSAAKQDLDAASKIFNQTKSYDQLLIFKWQSVIAAQENRTVGPLLKFKEEAIRRKHWESVREADLFSLKIKFNQNIFDHLVIGTPADLYQTRILQQVNSTPSCHYLLGTQNNILDIKTGRMEGQKVLNPGKKVHHVLSVLTADFYAPRNIGVLFSELYPEEHFNVESSPLKVRQLLSRTRRWLELNNLSAKITSYGGGYRISDFSNFGIRVPLLRDALGSFDIIWRELENNFKSNQRFSMREACRTLGITKSNFHRLVDVATSKGLISRCGTGKATQYYVCHPSESQAA